MSERVRAAFVPTWGAFVGLAAAVLAFEAAVASRLDRFDRPGVLAAAVVVDLAIVVPLLFWGLVVRRGRAPMLACVPVALIGVALAGWMLPADHRGAVEFAHLVLVPTEVGLLAWIGRRASRIVRRARSGDGTDFLLAMQRAAGETLGEGRVATVVAYEAAVLGYAFGAAPRVGETADGFSHHRERAYGAVVGAVALAGTAEIVGVHVLLSRWSAAAAWAVTALSLYAFVWVVGDLRAARRRRTTLDDDRLTIRVGLRWTVDVPYRAIASVGRIEPPGATNEPLRPLVATLIGPPSLRIRLDREVRARGPYGISRSVRVLDLAVDDAGAFETGLRARLARDAEP